jgi:hypothetical protein
MATTEIKLFSSPLVDGNTTAVVVLATSCVEDSVSCGLHLVGRRGLSGSSWPGLWAGRMRQDRSRSKHAYIEQLSIPIVVQEPDFHRKLGCPATSTQCCRSAAMHLPTARMSHAHR